MTALVACAPLGFVALEAGWVVTEAGRQPWVIYGILRTADAVTPVADVGVSLAVFTLLYATLLFIVVVFLRRLAAGDGSRPDGFPELFFALVMLAALVAYALLGCADFGGGIWDLLSSGPRAAAQRRHIAQAIGPVWEANHVWLIFLIVVLFTCFPAAYAAASVALFWPLHLILIGIVLRGASFVFRAYGSDAAAAQRTWSRIFGVASAVTPLLLGACLGAISIGDTGAGQPAGGAWPGWMAPFPLITGLLALLISAYLAAVYLAWESLDPENKPTKNQPRDKGLPAPSGISSRTSAGGRAHFIWLPGRQACGLILAATRCSGCGSADHFSRHPPPVIAGGLTAGRIPALALGRAPVPALACACWRLVSCCGGLGRGSASLPDAPRHLTLALRRSQATLCCRAHMALGAAASDPVALVSVSPFSGA